MNVHAGGLAVSWRIAVLWWQMSTDNRWKGRPWRRSSVPGTVFSRAASGALLSRS